MFPKTKKNQDEGGVFFWYFNININVVKGNESAVFYDLLFYNGQLCL